MIQLYKNFETFSSFFPPGFDGSSIRLDGLANRLVSYTARFIGQSSADDYDNIKVIGQVVHSDEANGYVGGVYT